MTSIDVNSPSSTPSEASLLALRQLNVTVVPIPARLRPSPSFSLLPAPTTPSALDGTEGQVQNVDEDVDVEWNAFFAKLSSDTVSWAEEFIVEHVAPRLARRRSRSRARVPSKDHPYPGLVRDGEEGVFIHRLDVEPRGVNVLLGEVI